MTRVEVSRFDTLRVWDGEQSRAFEELSFQLLKDRVPAGTRAIRTGNPDGGVEWYATLSDGTEWGWQAKHVTGIGPLLTAMTGSVRRVVKERPDLRKLTFVISWNLATGTRGGERTSQRQKYANKIKSWQKEIPGADKIKFELVMESDLLDELAKPEHNGRNWFWWGGLTLGFDWLEQRHQDQVAAASDKYRPDLQVDVPIQEDLLALGFDQSVRNVFERYRRDVVSAIDELHLPSPKDDDEISRLYREILDRAGPLKTAAGALVLEAGDPVSILEPLVMQMSACRDAIDAAENHELMLDAAWRELPEDDEKKGAKPPEWASGYGARELLTALDELLSWRESSVGQSFQRRTYLLTGQAGSGKTHLFLDATCRALNAGRPAVFLAGARFGHGNLWASMCDQLGLEDVGADILLRAMDAAGEAAATVGSRFLIFIDALNETTPADFWRIHLPALRAAVARYPHVALAVSCRDTYQDLVLEGAEGKQYVHRTHPGFAEREVEATERYFAHYSLEAPKIPLLTPEFTLPLFLRLYCESLAQSDKATIPTGHQGRVAIFERYLDAKITAVAHRFRPSLTSGYELNAAKNQVKKVIDALLDELSRLGRESMSANTAETVARVPLDNSAADAVKIIGLLQEEGVLTRERLYLGDGLYDEGVRIVFQAFADFLLLKRRLVLSFDPLNDQTVKEWIGEDCSWGVVEAATVLFPEVYGVELPDLLGVKLSSQPNRADERAAWDRYHRARQLYRSLVETLPYRDSQAISQRTIDLLNDTQRYMSRDEFYRVLFTLAPQPGNRLNGDGLHRYLLLRRMPQRDSDFGFATYHELSDPSGPVARLARWAARGPFPQYDPEVVELACIPLCWLLSTPNRFMRDWVTKALVQLLHGHLDVMRALVERFWTVDDPYIVQRVMAIAYGALLRSTPTHSAQAETVAELVHRLVFTQPVRADELLLDAARGVVRWATARGLLPASSLMSSQRPYGLTRPGPPPSKETIEAKYGWHKDQTDEESYSSINFSLLSMGDFGRYVVESGLHHFSRYRIGQEYPEHEYRKPRLIKRHWKIFLASLTDEQKRQLTELMDDPDQLAGSRLRFLVRGVEDPLSDGQRKLLDAAFTHPKQVNNDYPVSGARRWIFRRTISLGWTPKLFGREDRHRGHGSGRESHKAERWGKKYQWMAYHELLARVADNFQLARRYSDNATFEGLHQIIGDREIDPSLPPIDYRAFNDHNGVNTAAWGTPLISLHDWPPSCLEFNRYKGNIDAFLDDNDSEPTVTRTLVMHDKAGDDWIVLDGSFIQIDPTAAKSWRGLQQRSATRTLFFAAGEAEVFLATPPGESHRRVHDLIDRNGHTDCCYVGEVGRVAPACHHRDAELRPITVGETTYQVVSTTEEYTWEGSILDCSIGESATTILPSTFVQQAADLSFDMRGPSWLDATGSPVFVYYREASSDSHALLVKEAFLKDFLAAHKVELVAAHWFERMQLSHDHSADHQYIESTVEARVGADLAINEGRPHRTERRRVQDADQ